MAPLRGIFLEEEHRTRRRPVDAAMVKMEVSWRSSWIPRESRADKKPDHSSSAAGASCVGTDAL